jgi:integrase
MFCLSKRSNGYYYVFYDTPEGSRTCISTRTKYKSEALKFISAFEAELKQKLQNKVIQITLKDFYFQYLKYSESIHSSKTTKTIRVTFNFLLRHFGNVLLSEITPKKLDTYFQERIKYNSIYAARKDLINLSSSLNYAVKQKYLTDNPCKGFKRFKIPEKQPLFFSEIDFEVLLRVIDEPDIKDLVIFAVNTGLRQMELLTLEWNQINFKDKSLILDNRNHLTKSKRIRSVPLNIKALQVLTKREQNKSGETIFTLHGEPIKQDFISKKFKKYVLKAGLNSKLNFHSLRHSFASWLIQRGASIYSVSKLLGHSDIKVTEIYAHLRTEDLMNSVSKLN